MTLLSPLSPALPDHSALAVSLAQAGSGTMPVTELFNAAAQLQTAGQHLSAAGLYRHWLDHTPSPLAFAVYFNYAVTLTAEHDDTAAEQAYLKAIALNPGFVEARLNLGTLHERGGRPDQALDTWRAILTITPPVEGNVPMYLQTLNNLGRLLEIRKQYPAAEEMLAQSLRVDPQQPHVMTHWVHLRQKQCKWPVYSGLEHISVDTMMEGTSALAMLSASGDPAQQLAAARRFVEEKVNADVAPLTGKYGYGHQRLRIGYLSSDFCSHAVSILTAELYELHDRSKVEVYAFSWSREDHSPLRARVVRAMDHYIRIDAMNDEQAAHCIRDHEIDILVDLHGLTLGARPNIIAYRPAPVQLTYLGFPGSTGLPGIDYVLADEFLIPPELALHFSEQPLYLPDTFQINDRQRQIGVTPQRASCGLPQDAFVYCSFNNNFKFTPEVFGVWMAILRRVPGSVLWLVADYDEVRENLWRHAEQAGIARERLIFAGRAAPADYLARYRLADLFLDTMPFNGGTTASDALWAGLPLLTCAGATFSSRMAGSLLRAVDLPQLITYDLAGYEELAVQLAAQPERIAAMKRQLADNRLSCALFDSPRFVRNLEALLQRVAKPAAPGAAAPLSGRRVNRDLLALTPPAARRVVELGCRDGAFASAWRQRNPHGHYTGIEADPAAAHAARSCCDAVLQLDLESADPHAWAQLAGADCWILDQMLERMNDPWALLSRIRNSLAPGGQVVAAIGNFQHWSIQARLNAGDLRYGPGAALERGHKRAFTRGAMLDLFQQAGLRITGGSARVPDEPMREKYLPAIRMMAQASGIDPAVAVEDALPTQYILVATLD